MAMHEAVPCSACRLRPLAFFRPLSAGEAEFIQQMKSAQIIVAARAKVIEAGEVGGSLYTLYDGWAIRYRMLGETQRRQILDVVLPGDFVGLEAHVLGLTEHSVQALTPASLCVLRGRRLSELFERHPDWGLSLLRWMVEDQRRGDVWRSILGRLDAAQRMAYLFLEVFDRLEQRGMASEGSCRFPLSGQHLADMLGLSRAHVSRVLADFAQRRWARIESGTLLLHERDTLAELAGYRGVARGPRVLL
jgi:CRP/FNR family transcriptional regulator, anaerobic regulatory protein